MKINRLLVIVVMLLNKDKISAVELAEKFDKCKQRLKK